MSRSLSNLAFVTVVLILALFMADQFSRSHGFLASLASCMLGVLLIYPVHCALDSICLRHALRFCRRRGSEVRRGRVGIYYDEQGLKTEFTVVELDCLDGQKQRKLLRLLVWVFGVRKVLNDDVYPDSHDEQWPKGNG